VSSADPNGLAPAPSGGGRPRRGGRTYLAEGGPGAVIGPERIAALADALLAALGPLRRVLLLPPDTTRRHSGAGELTALLYRRLAPTARVEVLPALGTHAPMRAEELAAMFPGIPLDRFHVHSFRDGVVSLGEVPATFVREVSGGRVDYPIRCEVARRLVEGRWDRILSVGQLVPHEVAGIAGHDKNVFVGAGGKDAIDRTHFLGAVAGIEAVLGRTDTPVRAVLAYMAAVLGRELPVTHLMAVRARTPGGAMVTRGLFAGDGYDCFAAGAALARECNVEVVPAPLRKVVAYLEPGEYRSTWVGNKAIYRARMALADGGELLILAPGVTRFGEDAGLDRLIRRHGYRGTAATLAAITADPELMGSLSAAAHLIHGASEGRFRISYAPGGLSREEITGVGYEYVELAAALCRYDPTRLVPGPNVLADGEEIYFLPNPAVGLWSTRERLADG